MAERKKVILNTVVIIAIVALVFAGNSYPITIAVEGWWFTDADTSSLVAGEELPGTRESPSDQTLVEVDNTSKTWEIQVNKSDVFWRSGFTLSIRRTGEGHYDVDPPTGGTDYQEVTDTATYLWDASDRVWDVPHQFKITGISSSIPVDDYETHVTFTVVETE